MTARQVGQNRDKRKTKSAFRVVGTFRRRPRLHGLCHAPSGPQPTSTIMCASPGIARATCAPDSHHLQLSAVLVQALTTEVASPLEWVVAIIEPSVWHTRGCVWSVPNTSLRHISRPFRRRCCKSFEAFDAPCRATENRLTPRQSFHMMVTVSTGRIRLVVESYGSLVGGGTLSGRVLGYFLS